MVTINITQDLSNIKNLTDRVRQDYADRLLVPLKLAILKDILRGVSPVAGERFPKYSKSYKDSIRGKVQFFTVSNGGAKKVIAIKAGRGEKFPTLPFVLGKRLSPVNLKLSGQMLSSLIVRKIGGGMTKRIEILFDDEVATYHNKLGAGKSKVKRRLLPTESGEKFNRRITRLNITLLEKSVSTILREINRP